MPSSVVGILRAILTADTGQYDTSMRKAAQTADQTAKKIGGIGPELGKLAPQAERMVKAFQGDKLLYQANNVAAAVQKIGGAQKLTASEQARVNATLTQAIEKYKALGQQAPAALTALQKATTAAVAPTQNLTKQMLLATTAGTFLGNALFSLARTGMRALWGEFKQAIDLSNKATSAFLGLSSVASAFGVQAADARRAADELASDGLMQVSDAALGLKNLLATGFNLDEATQLMMRFKDAAAFGRQSSLEFGYAVTSATEGIKNQNSILVDNAGVTKNLSIMLKEAGFSAADLGRVSTDAKVRMALFNGIMRETNAQVGDADRLTKTYTGSLSKLNTQYNFTLRIFGEAITKNQTVVEAFNLASNAIIGLNKELVHNGQAFTLVSDIVIGFVRTLSFVIKATNFVAQGFLYLATVLQAFMYGTAKIGQAIDGFILGVLKAVAAIPGATIAIRGLSSGIQRLQYDYDLSGAKAHIYGQALAATGERAQRLSDISKTLSGGLDRAADRLEKTRGKSVEFADAQVKARDAVGQTADALDEGSKAAKSFSQRMAELGNDVARGLSTLSDDDFVTEFASKLENAYREFAKLGITGKNVPKDIYDGFVRIMAIRFDEWIRKDNEELRQLAGTLGFLNDEVTKLDDNITEAIGKSIEATTGARLKSLATGNQIEFQRAEFAIEQAKRTGATWQQIAAMETALAKRKTDVAIAESDREFRERVKDINLATSVGQNEYEALALAHNLNVQQMHEAFVQAEILKRQELLRTHNFWLQLQDRIKDGFHNLVDSATSNLGNLLFNFGHDMDGSLKKSAQEAREAYEELTGASAEQTGKVAKAKQDLATAQMAYDAAKARKADAFELQGLSKQLAQARITYQEISKEGKGSAKEIQDAFDRMREAEEAANNGFGKRFTELWRGIKQSLFGIFNDILGMFTKQLLGGMLKALMGSRGGFAGAFGSLGSGIVAGDGAVGMGLGGGLLGKLGGLFGIGGGAAAGTTSIVAGGVPVVAGTGAAGGVGIAATGGAAAGAGGAGAGAGGTAAGVGAGIGTAATIALTGGIAGAALLAWGIGKKGLFRGGWEGIQGNQRRDMHLAQWGPPGTGPDSGFHKLAAFLTSKTGEPGGGSIFKDFLSGDKKRFEAAQAAIVAMGAQSGKQVKSFSLGGFIPPGVVQPAILHGGAMGELVMPVKSRPHTSTGLDRGGGASTVNVYLTVEGLLDAGTFTKTMDQHLPRWIRMGTILNTGNVNDALKVAVAR